MDPELKIITESIPLGGYTNLSSQLFDSACLFLDLLEKLDEGNEAEFKTAEKSYNAYSLSVILLCTTALEARVGEFYFSLPNSNKLLSKQAMNDKKRNNKKKNNAQVTVKVSKTASKYNSILFSLNKEQYLLTDELYINISKLSELRNSIIHYNPEIHYAGGKFTKTSQEMYDLFADVFSERPFSNQKLDYFTSRCIGYGAAKWAVKTTYLFWEDYFNKTKNKEYIKHFTDMRPLVEKYLI